MFDGDRQGVDTTPLFFHYKYLENALDSGEGSGPAGVGIFVVKMAPGSDRTEVMSRIDALFEQEGQVLPVLLGQRGDRQHHVGDVDALAVGQLAADLHSGGNALAGCLGDRQPDLAVFNLQVPVQRAAVNQVRRLAACPERRRRVILGQRPESQPLADIPLVLRMDIVVLADVGGDGHAGVGRFAERHRLGFPKLGARAGIKGWGTPITFVIWVFLSLHVLGWGETVIGALEDAGRADRVHGAQQAAGNVRGQPGQLKGKTGDIQLADIGQE